MKRTRELLRRLTKLIAPMSEIHVTLQQGVLVLRLLEMIYCGTLLTCKMMTWINQLMIWSKRLLDGYKNKLHREKMLVAELARMSRMQLRRVVREGEMYPRFYGYAWMAYDFEKGVGMVAYPIPLNLALALGRGLYKRLRWGWRNSTHFRGYREGFFAGVDRTVLAALDWSCEAGLSPDDRAAMQTYLEYWVRRKVRAGVDVEVQMIYVQDVGRCLPVVLMHEDHSGVIVAPTEPRLFGQRVFRTEDGWTMEASDMLMILTHGNAGTGDEDG